MIFFATFLRAMAAIFITNSHYVGVYPIDIIANGGLLGDVLFFSLSGFVLINIRESFLNWYRHRFLRIYPTIWIITTFYIIFGFYNFNDFTFLNYYIYPTYYHFIASIIVLYIPYFIVRKNKILFDNIPKVMMALLFIEMIVYIFLYNKSYYHIDVVREPMIRFLFFQAMLLGLYFRKNKDKYINSNKWYNWIILMSTIIVYFISKLLFSRINDLSSYQLINQILIFVVLYYFLRCFSGIDNKLENLPKVLKKAISFVAEITLEIYAVQYVIIPRLKHIIFPINWIVITFTIIISAYILRVIGTKSSSKIENLLK